MGDWSGLAEQLIRERGPRLVAYAAMLVERDEDARDLVHDALVKVFSKRRRLGSLAEAEAYVRAAMPTLVIDRARARASRRRTAVRAFERPPAGVDSDTGVDVRRALRELPRREQVCVVLRFFDDLTVPQIADRLGLSEGAVKRYLYDAKARLAPLLDVTEDWDDETTVTVVPLSEGNR